MIATPRATNPEGDGPLVDPADDVATRISSRDVQAAAMEMMNHAMRTFEAAREERLRAEAATAELRRERERFTFEYDRLRSDRHARAQAHRFDASRPTWSLLRSLQFVAGCVLAGVVMTGVVFGHDVHGFDPGYIGGLLGLLAGGSVWAIRGL